jgi:hypothetical protein
MPSFLWSVVASQWASTRPASEKPWVAYFGVSSFHYMGYTTWLGLSKGVPLAMYDQIQRVIEDAGLDVQREYARLGEHRLSPIMATTARGLELLFNHLDGWGAYDLGALERAAGDRLPDLYVRPYMIV